MDHIDWHDFGDCEGAGAWSRSLFVYFIGLGAELFITKRVSLRLDYRHISSS